MEKFVEIGFFSGCRRERREGFCSSKLEFGNEVEKREFQQKINK